MKLTPHIILLVVLICIAHSSIVSDVKDNVLTFIQQSIGNYKSDYEENTAIKNGYKINDGHADVKQANAKARIVKKYKGKNQESSQKGLDHWQLRAKDTERGRYRIDPVLNFLSRRAKAPIDDGTSFSSSSRELQDWKDEWREHWIQKKYEAINSSMPAGDAVNMLAARPWGVPCGDPNQHDMPWGTCMLSLECDSEFRIYRGDYFCGRTQFVCCGLQLTSYDMYQGFDVSFADSELATDSEEVRNREAGSKERKRRKKLREKRRRRRNRLKRKRQIKRQIKKIIKEIRKILSRTYRNGTTAKKKKTKQLKKFIKKLKNQYKKDRKSVKNIHEIDLMKIDKKLRDKLNQIKGMNQNFIKNQTFRDIIVNGSVSQKTVRMLVESYPELAKMLDSTRRSNGRKPDYLDYDIEYGLLYY